MRHNVIHWALGSAAIFLVALFLPGEAQAQTYPCPGGPGPGEQQVGVTGGSHGIASTPVCASSNGPDSGGGSYSQPSAPLAPGIPVNNFFAIAVHPKLPDVWATAGQYRLEAAEAVVMDGCSKTMGPGCTIIRSGANSGVAVAHDGQGKMLTALGAHPKDARKAIQTLCKTQKSKCKNIRVFDARIREEVVGVELIRDDLDKDGLFKSYYFPPSSVVPTPKMGQPDVGYSVKRSIVSHLPQIEGTQTIHHSDNGTWLMKAGDKKGMSCSAIYFKGDTKFMMSGPTVSSPGGAIVFSGKAVPATATMRETKVTITDSDGSATVTALHAPGDAESGPVLMVPTNMKSTVARMSDRSPIKFALDGKTVFDIQMEGGRKLQSAMQQCMAKR